MVAAVALGAAVVYLATKDRIPALPGGGGSVVNVFNQGKDQAASVVPQVPQVLQAPLQAIPAINISVVVEAAKQATGGITQAVQDAAQARDLSRFIPLPPSFPGWQAVLDATEGAKETVAEVVTGITNRGLTQGETSRLQQLTRLILQIEDEGIEDVPRRFIAARDALLAKLRPVNVGGGSDGLAATVTNAFGQVKDRVADTFGQVVDLVGLDDNADAGFVAQARARLRAARDNAALETRIADLNARVRETANAVREDVADLNPLNRLDDLRDAAIDALEFPLRAREAFFRQIPLFEAFYRQIPPGLDFWWNRQRARRAG